MIAKRQRLWAAVCATVLSAGIAAGTAEADTLNVVATTGMIADAILGLVVIASP